MGTSTGRLSLASDGYSEVALADKTIGTAPQFSGCVNNRYGAGPTPHRDQANEDADMAERTRTAGLSDSRTPDTAVKITPAMQTGPVTTTTGTR